MWFRNRFAVKFLLLLVATSSAFADVSIIRLANEGAIITDGETRIMIDGMVVEPYSIYGGLPAELAADFDRAAGVFEGINLALASHRHHDHNQPRFACNFLQASERTRFASSPQVLGLMREKCRELVTTSPRITEILPVYGEPLVLEEGGARITVFPLSHGTRKYARIQNFGHLFELGGVTILHIGDAAMDATDFQRAGLDGIEIDVALIPFWYFQPGPGVDVIRRYMDAPAKLAVHIPPGEMEEVKDHLQVNFPRVVVLEQPLDQVSFSGSPPSNP